MGIPQETTIDKAYEALKYMEDTRSKNRQKSICHLCPGVFRKEEPTVIIGRCGPDGEAEIGKTVLFYMIDEKYRSRVYATQRAVSLLNYAFGDMEYDLLYAAFWLLFADGHHPQPLDEHRILWYILNR